MTRRHFSLQLAATAAAFGLGGLAAAPAARAQGGFVEGQHYKRLSPPVPIPANGGKVEVIEFFSYACPHCNEFEPALEAWVARLPADVHFHRIPVPFLFNAENFQRLYFSLEAMNLVDSHQRKVFAAVHMEHQKLLKPDDIAALMTRHGVDATKFMSYFNSFSMQSKVRQAKQLVDSYHLEGVPVLAIQGRFVTSPADAGGADQALRAADFLISQVRAGR